MEFVKQKTFHLTVLIMVIAMWCCQPVSGLTEDERNTIDVVKRSTGSVVFVTNIQRVRGSFFSQERVERGTGSGFLWDDKGHIVTNSHVVEGGEAFTVTLANQKNYQARLVGQEPNKDIAVLRIVDVGDEIKPVRVGSSSNLLVGQKVIAIGNPFGFDQTVTTGIISSVGRKIQGFGGVTIRDMVQTDASINPGNSGGPLLNSDGELIGMNTLIYSSTGTSSGIGFAVPVNTIKRIVPQLIQYGKVIRPGLGVTIISDQVARRSGVRKGVIVREATRGGNAYRAGIRGLVRDEYGRIYIQDVIIGIDDFEVKSYDDLYNALDRYKIGDIVTVTLERNDKKRQVKVKLARIN